MKTLLSLAFIGLLGYGVLLGYVYFFQAQLIYFPNIGIAFGAATPADIGLGHEDVRFRTADGLNLHGWYVPAADTSAIESSAVDSSGVDSSGVLLFMHGNAGTISHRLDSIEIFHKLGLSVFIFDYRGYGESEGRTNEQGTYRDAEAAWRYLVEDRGIDPGKIVIFGRSLGASIATWLASRTQPAALIAESAFTSAPDLAAVHYRYLPVRALARISYDTRASMEKVACPVLVIHSGGDEIVPFDHGRELFSVANQPKSFLELRGGHNDAFFVSRGIYQQALGDFFDKVLGDGEQPISQ